MKDYREMADNVLRRRDAYRMKRRKSMKITASVLSGFCIIAVLGVGGWYSGILAGDGSEQVRDVQPKDIASADTFDEVKRPSEKQEAAQSSIEDFSAEKNDGNLTSPEDSGADSGITPEQTGSETTIDVPVSDIPGDTGALTAYDEVWGGCYMDQNGCWVVWLTEDTPENRQTVFSLNPTLGEDNTTFKAADYSKAYLMDLMARISSAMGSGKLPFVTTASLREDKNCVQVTTVADDPSSINQILAFDTASGDIADDGVETTIYGSDGHAIITAHGAIEILYNPEDYVIMDLIKDPLKNLEEP